MADQEQDLYDVVIFEKESRKISTFIGKALKLWDGEGTGRHTADLRVQSGLERINERFDCIMVAAGKYQQGDILPASEV